MIYSLFELKKIEIHKIRFDNNIFTIENTFI